MLKLFAFALLVSFCAAEPTALLIVQKSITTPENVFAVGINFTVTLDIINIGDRSATDVQVTDPWPLQSFQVVEGTNEASWEEIPAGEKVSHSFTFQPNQDGVLSGFNAILKYTAVDDEEAEPQTGASSHMYQMTIYPRAAYDRYVAKHYEEWTIFLASAFSTVVLPFIYWIYIQHAYENGVPRSSKAKSA